MLPQEHNPSQGESLASPSSSMSGNYNDTDTSRWSFPASQYRQSAIIEMGSAVPMEIVNHDEPKEIQIREARDSIASMNNLVSSLSSQRDAVRQVSRRSQPSKHTRMNSGSSSVGRVVEEDEELYTARGDITSGSSWLPNTNGRPLRKSDFALGPPPTSSAPVSPLSYPDPVLKMKTAYSHSSRSSISMKDIDEFASARDFSIREISDDSHIHSSSDQSPEAEAQRKSSSPDSRSQQSRQQKKLEHMNKLRDIIDDDASIKGGYTHHARSISEPTHKHPLPSVPKVSQELLSREVSSRMPIKSEETSVPLYEQLLNGLPKDSTSVRHVRKVKKPLARDTIAPHVVLKDDAADQVAESTQYSPHESPNTHSSKSESSRHSHSNPAYTSDSGHSKKKSSKHHRRNFTKKSIENMLQSQNETFDITDIGLPTPERRLMEKFIHSLSKLSIEVQMDEGKREEGRRRLQNALRALEGWI